MENHRNILAEVYVKFLKTIDWSDELLVRGLSEGRNKFLSNAHIALFDVSNKYHKSHFVSHAALKLLESGSRKGLIFEHMVPKKKYIQDPCESHAKAGMIDGEFVKEILNKYWHIATITSGENDKLAPNRFPDDWDGEDVMRRYSDVSIKLRDNEFFVKACTRLRHNSIN